MKDSTQTLGQAMKSLAAVEGVLRRRSRHLHDLTAAGLLATDLNGFANLREQYAQSMAEWFFRLQACGVPEDVLSSFNDTVPVVPNLWDAALPVEPPESIVQQVRVMFPEWSADFAAMVMDSRTTVDITGMDPDARDGAEILRDLDLRGHGDATKAEAGDDLGRVVERVLRMAAMFDLYMDLRVRSTRITKASTSLREKIGHLNPLWALLGLGVAEAAASTAAGVLKSAVVERKRKVPRRSTAELAELIMKVEGR